MDPLAGDLFAQLISTGDGHLEAVVPQDVELVVHADAGVDGVDKRIVHLADRLVRTVRELDAPRVAEMGVRGEENHLVSRF